MFCHYLYLSNAAHNLRFFAVILSLWAGFAHAAPFAYVTNNNSNSVSVIDTATNTVVATVPVGIGPEGVAVNPAGARVYVANYNSNNISAIDTATNAVVATVLVGVNPIGVAVNPAGTLVYVTNYSSNSVSVINTTSNTVVATIAVGALPWGIAVNPAGTRVYVANFNSGTVSVIDTASNTVAATVAVFGARSVVVNPAGTRVYVLKSNGIFSVVDTATNTVIASVNLVGGAAPQTIALNPAGTRAYVTAGTLVSVFDTATNTLVSTVAGNTLEGIAVSDTRAYVTSVLGNNVSVIDTATNTVVATVPVGSTPTAVAVFVTPAPPPATDSRLINLSTRGQVQTGDNVMIGGFIIGGASPKTVLIRAVGPNLANFGVPGVLANPTMQLFSGQTVIASNDDWQSAANAAAIQATGLAPAVSLESAILVSLLPGPYTAIVSGVGGGTGVGIVEVFEIGNAIDVDNPGDSLINLSTRGRVETGDNVMIGGFIIQGTTPQTVLIRAVGPNLANFGVQGVLANPTLQLFSGQTVIASNDDWGSASNAAAIQATGLAPANSLESAILVTLAPGAYTAIVSGFNGGVGVGIVEVFAQ